MLSVKNVLKRIKANGYSPVFSRRPWENGVRSNNCYAYAVGDFQDYRRHKSIPGDRSGLSKLPHTYTHCKDLARRVISDNPDKVYKVPAKKLCKKGYYKIMMFVAPTNSFGDLHGDFHFYKQHEKVDYKVKPGETTQSIAKFFHVPMSTIQMAGPVYPGRILKFKANIWSHKQGWATGALLKDASGKAILNPLTANRKYTHNYSKYCCSFCVKTNGIKVGPSKSKKSGIKNLLKFV